MFSRTTWILVGIGCIGLFVFWWTLGRTQSPAVGESLDRARANLPVTTTPNFADLEAFSSSRQIRRHKVFGACEGLGRSCLEFLQSDQQSFAGNLEADQDYADHVLSMPALALSKEDLFGRGPSLADIIEARVDVYVSELVNHGRIRATTVAKALGSGRASLARSNTLLERMILTAVTGIDLRAANLALQADPGSWSGLEHHLAALTPQESSMQRAFDGELLYASWVAERGLGSFGFKPEHMLNVSYKRNAAHLGDSETPWADYWSSKLSGYRHSVFEYLIDPLSEHWLGLDDPDDPNHSGRFVAEVRSLDGISHIVRAMHQSPITRPKQIPSVKPLAHWQWEWQDDVSLCLTPESVHPSRLRYATEICLDWVGDL